MSFCGSLNEHLVGGKSRCDDDIFDLIYSLDDGEGERVFNFLINDMFD